MKILYSQTEISFIELKNRLNTSNGNILSHIRFLEQDGFIEFRKEFGIPDMISIPGDLNNLNDQ